MYVCGVCVRACACAENPESSEQILKAKLSGKLVFKKKRTRLNHKWFHFYFYFHSINLINVVRTLLKRGFYYMTAMTA